MLKSRQKPSDEFSDSLNPRNPKPKTLLVKPGNLTVQCSEIRERTPMTEWEMVVPERTTQPSPRMERSTVLFCTLLGGRKRDIV